jgi:hypothetical protein
LTAAHGVHSVKALTTQHKFKEYIMIISRLKALAVLISSIFLVACASTTDTIYKWEGYQKNVYQHFRGDKSPAEQTQSMQADLEKIRASGKATPPGYQAHLGLLYGQQGNLDQFAAQIQAEKNQFPESETFMDFLLRKFKKDEVKQ